MSKLENFDLEERTAKFGADVIRFAKTQLIENYKIEN